MKIASLSLSVQRRCVFVHDTVKLSGGGRLDRRSENSVAGKRASGKREKQGLSMLQTSSASSRPERNDGNGRGLPPPQQPLFPFPGAHCRALCLHKSHSGHRHEVALTICVASAFHPPPFVSSLPCHKRCRCPNPGHGKIVKIQEQ